MEAAMDCRKIELEFSSEPVDLHCPVCGAVIFVAGTKQECCSHLLFWAESESGEWAWTKQGFEALFAAKVEHLYQEALAKGYFGSLADFQATMKAGKAAEIAALVAAQNSTFMFSVSTSDVGCGGMHNGTFYALFDYLPNRKSRSLFSLSTE